ncbi:Fungal specific transcription factor [Rhizina undulata]
MKKATDSPGASTNPSTISVTTNGVPQAANSSPKPSASNPGKALNSTGGANAATENKVNGNNGTGNSSTAGTGNGTTGVGSKGRRDRPCDACRRRKSRCVMNEGADICVLCGFHSQECTFVQSPQPRKRRLASATGSANSEESVAKKRSTEPESPQEAANRENVPVDDYSRLLGPSLKTTLGLQSHRHSQYIGPTSEYEACLIDLCPFDSNDEYSLSQGGGSFRRVSDESTFIMYPDHPTQNHAETFDDLDAIERIVAPHGQSLINLYFRIVHPSFPILHKKVFLEKYSRTHREFSPSLLAAVYILALHWWSYDRELALQKKPDVAALEKLASKTIADVIHRPKLSTVQAGLLLLQRHSDLKGGSWALTSQLVAVGQELGLHLDCGSWKIPPWEKGLRKRLAWGLFMQDKWGALTHGRPSHITKANWEVPPVTKEDFPERSADEDDEDSSEVEKGRMLYEQMISLSGMMADVLDTFFTIEAQKELSGRGGTNRVLERAKPIQIRLKEWFMKLPECLRMDATKVRKLSSNGYLHLAYFATEITLHRQILRSLCPPTNIDPTLLNICRSAAKTRLISAMDFVNRLKPEHLQSFWYFASKANFALIGTFGSLLWATSPSLKEAEFYKARLSEYRWTLRVSSRGAEFMEFAVGVLDASAGYLQQEQFKKRGILYPPPAGYTSTVGAGDGFGLGMGVGLGLSDSSVPPPPPISTAPIPSTAVQQWRGSEFTHQEQGHLSPLTGDEDDSEDEDGMEIDVEHDENDEGAESDDGSAASNGRRYQREHDHPGGGDGGGSGGGHYTHQSHTYSSSHLRGQTPSAVKHQSSPTQNKSAFSHHVSPYQQQHPYHDTTPTATTPNSTSSGLDFFMIPNTIPGRRAASGGEPDFLATTGWRGRRDGED